MAYWGRLHRIDYVERAPISKKQDVLGVFRRVCIEDLHPKVVVTASAVFSLLVVYYIIHGRL